MIYLIAFLMIISVNCNKLPLPIMDVYLCIGQSNMVGEGYPIDQSDNGSTAYLFNGSGWEAADGHLNRYSTIYTYNGGLSPANNFGKIMALSSSNKVGLIVNAKGATSVYQWDNGYVYDAITRTQQATNRTHILKGILWQQGESDRFNSAGYMSILSSMVAKLRAELGSVPFYAGECAQGAKYAAINAVIDSIPQYISNSFVISSQGLTTTDGTHYNAASVRVLGERYANQAIVN